ncbi:MAG: helix-turn-helix transcriptional regulator [Lachnospiraceae bacterium]|nr:helix-turn-helix transcriptional regulator [Lachnospiraceae bacterium]
MGTDVFRERLKLCMDRESLNGADLSAASGISAATISRYLCGLRRPTVENVVRLSSALGVSSDYLLGLHDSPDCGKLVRAYSSASSEDRRVIWTLLERYGGNNEAPDRN